MISRTLSSRGSHGAGLSRVTSVGDANVIPIKLFKDDDAEQVRGG